MKKKSFLFLVLSPVISLFLCLCFLPCVFLIKYVFRLKTKPFSLIFKSLKGKYVRPMLPPWTPREGHLGLFQILGVTGIPWLVAPCLLSLSPFSQGLLTFVSSNLPLLSFMKTLTIGFMTYPKFQLENPQYLADAISKQSCSDILNRPEFGEQNTYTFQHCTHLNTYIQALVSCLLVILPGCSSALLRSCPLELSWVC